MSTSSLQKRRADAFKKQNGRCCYCGFEMWTKSAYLFAKEHRISVKQAKHFQCTAEHLQARQDGGSDAAKNIAAACRRCNELRHNRRSNPPTPSDYQEHVQKRLDKGKWCALPSSCNLSRDRPAKLRASTG